MPTATAFSSHTRRPEKTPGPPNVPSPLPPGHHNPPALHYTSLPVFINYVDNAKLDGSGFAPFGIVVGGADLLLKVFNPTPGESAGVDQSLYKSKGDEWIRKEYPDINFISRASLRNATPPAASPPSSQSCELLDGFGVLIQLAVGLLAFSVLICKVCRQRDRCPVPPPPLARNEPNPPIYVAV